MARKPEPATYSAFVTRALAELEKEFAKVRDKSKKDAATERTELTRVAQRGERVRNLLASSVWTEDLATLLHSSASVRPWRPGDPTDHAAVLNSYVYKSGHALALAGLEAQLLSWVAEGERAQQRLRQITEDDKRLAQRGRT